MKNLPHPPPYLQWHDFYEHCHKCKQVAVKNEMVKIATNERLCVECAAKHIEHQKQAMDMLAKFAADMNSRAGYLERTIQRAYNCKEWCECLDTLEPVVKESKDAQ
jgi:hypothetical protein